MATQKNVIREDIEKLLVASRLTKYEVVTKLLKGAIPKATFYDFVSGRHHLLTAQASIILAALREYVDGVEKLATAKRHDRLPLRREHAAAGVGVEAETSPAA